jgi:hypothetical protein
VAETASAPARDPRRYAARRPAPHSPHARDETRAHDRAAHVATATI